MATSLTEDDIFAAKLTKCMYLFVGSVLDTVLQDLSVNGNQPNANETLNDLAEQNNKTVSVTASNESIKYFDITAIFSKIVIVKNEHNLSEKEEGKILLENILGIKIIRNKFYHGITFDKDSLTSFKNDLIDFIKKICNCMVGLFPELNEYESLGKTTEENINELWKYDFSEDYAELRTYMKIRDKDSFGKFFKACQDELGKMYKSTFDSFKFPNVNNSEFYISLEEIFVTRLLKKEKKKISYQEMFKSDERSHKGILLSGEVGLGKTTLCKKLILEWCQSHTNEINSSKKCKKIIQLEDFDLVLFIEVKSVKENSLSQYLKEVLLPDSLSDKSQDDIHYFLNQLTTVLVVIDDFARKSNEASNVISDLFNILSDQWFLFTAIPEQLNDVYSSRPTYFKILTIDMLDLGEDEMECYVNKFFKILKKKKYDCLKSKAEFMSRLKTLPQQIKTIPFINIMLILWISMNEKCPIMHTSTELHNQYLILQKENLMKEFKDLKGGNQIVSEFIDEFTKHCYEKFMHGTDVDEILLEIYKQMNSSGSYNPKYIKVFFSAFLSVSCIRNHASNENNMYRFLHRSQMEFLVAFYIVSYLELNKVNIVFHNEDFGILKFVVGLLNKDKFKSTDKTISNILRKNFLTEYNLLWLLLNETMTGNSPSSEFCTILQDLFPDSNWNLNNKNLVNALKILCYTSTNFFIKSMKICIKNSHDPYKIPLLKSTLAELVNKKVHKRIAVELHLKKHEFEQDFPCVSDDILKCFQSWASITKFSGCLEKIGIEILKEECCNNLTDIKVRIKSAEELNLLGNSCTHHKKLKCIYIIFDKPFEKGILKCIQPFCDNEGKICLRFNYVSGIEMKSVITMVKKLKPSQQPFDSLYMKSNVSLQEAKNRFPTLDGLISKLLVEPDNKNSDIIGNDACLELNRCGQFEYICDTDA